jgi:hemoglobin-like flavoprotein
MTPEQISLVQHSFQKVLPIADQAAALFYERLFAIDPSAKALFHNDMREQGRKLMGMLHLAVEGLNSLEKIVPTLEAMGVRHASYGVTDGQYESVGAALLWTLEQGLGPAFTPEVKDAWAATYTLLADTMRRAA